VCHGPLKGLKDWEEKDRKEPCKLNELHNYYVVDTWPKNCIKTYQVVYILFLRTNNRKWRFEGINRKSTENLVISTLWNM
jgi:hypothetical protein